MTFEDYQEAWRHTLRHNIHINSMAVIFMTHDNYRLLWWSEFCEYCIWLEEMNEQYGGE